MTKQIALFRKLNLAEFEENQRQFDDLAVQVAELSKKNAELVQQNACLSRDNRKKTEDWELMRGNMESMRQRLERLQYDQSVVKNEVLGLRRRQYVLSRTMPTKVAQLEKMFLAYEKEKEGQKNTGEIQRDEFAQTHETRQKTGRLRRGY